MNNKNKLKGVLIGGLLLAAPFATFAAVDDVGSSFGNRMGVGKGYGGSQGTLLDEPYVDERYIERLDVQIEQKIENAKYLIEQLVEDDDSVDVDRLNEIVEEFAELDAELDGLDVEDALADELKEIFFETRDEAIALTTEFREIITEAFSSDEVVELRAELQQRSGLGYSESRGRGSMFGAEVIAVIDEDIAEQLDSDEITLEEAHDLIREKMESMSEDELSELRYEIREAMPGDGFERGEGRAREGSGRGSGFGRNFK